MPTIFCKIFFHLTAFAQNTKPSPCNNNGFVRLKLTKQELWGFKRLSQPPHIVSTGVKRSGEMHPGSLRCCAPRDDEKEQLTTFTTPPLR